MIRMIGKHNVLIPAILLFSLLRPLYASDIALEDRVRKFTLKNGMRVLMLERPLSPTVALYIRQRAGAVDEASGKSGTAHMLEHMMFKGTTSIGTRDYESEREILDKIKSVGRQLDQERRQPARKESEAIEELQTKLKALQDEHRHRMIPNEVDRIYTEHGAEAMNASTGHDVTTYHVSLPSNRIELWARIESDRLQNPVFREFYTERDVILEERRQRIETNPSGKLAEQFFAAAFHAHPYGTPILGWPSDMRFLDMDDLSAFFHKARNPQSMVVAAVGDIHIPDTLDIIRKYFEQIPAQKTQPPFITEEPPQSGERRVEVVFDAKPQLMIGYHKPPPPAREDFIFDVIEAVLSAGRTSRLYRATVEGQKIAESVSAANGMPGARYPNLFIIYAVPRHPHECGELEQAVYAEVKRLAREPVPERELQKVKNKIRTDFIRRLNSNSTLASMLSYYEVLLGDYRYLMNYLKAVDAVTADDIMQVAQKYLTRENRTVATLVAKTTSGSKSGKP